MTSPTSKGPAANADSLLISTNQHAVHQHLANILEGPYDMPSKLNCVLKSRNIPYVNTWEINDRYDLRAYMGSVFD